MARDRKNLIVLTSLFALLSASAFSTVADEKEAKTRQQKWNPTPFAPLRKQLEKQGWYLPGDGPIRFFDEGNKVNAVTIGKGKRRVLKAGRTRDSYVMLTAPIDSRPGTPLTVSQTSTPGGKREKIVLELFEGDVRFPSVDYFLYRHPDQVKIVSVTHEAPKDTKEKPGRAKPARPKPNVVGKKPLVLSKEPAEIIARMSTITLHPTKNVIRKRMYLQRRLELFEDGKLIQCWYSNDYAHLALEKKVTSKQAEPRPKRP